jgi:hypothetical protein
MLFPNEVWMVIILLLEARKDFAKCVSFAVDSQATVVLDSEKRAHGDPEAETTFRS